MYERSTDKVKIFKQLLIGDNEYSGRDNISVSQRSYSQQSSTSSTSGYMGYLSKRNSNIVDTNSARVREIFHGVCSSIKLKAFSKTKLLTDIVNFVGGSENIRKRNFLVGTYLYIVI